MSLIQASPDHALVGRHPSLAARVLAVALAAALGMAALGAPAAFADVRGDDLIEDRTVTQRGLPAIACPNVTAEHVYVMDSEGFVYFARDAQTRSHIASITKVMTAIVALDSGLSLDSTITVGADAASVGESSAALQAGDTLTLKAALTGLMVPSGNDAAIAIAEAVGAALTDGDSQSAQDAFVAAMNDKAAELGMTDTLFANPHGLDIGDHDKEMYSTARDVGIMCAYAMQNETFRDIVSQERAQISVTRADGKVTTLDLTSTDLLLGTYEGACGIKTGYTGQAGQSFAGACERDGLMLFAIVLDAPSETARFEDAKTLFSWVYDNRMTYALAHSDQTVSMEVDGQTEQVPLIAKVPQSAWLDKTVDATLADPGATVEVVAFEGNVSQEFSFLDLPGSVRAGDVVGSVSFYQNNECIASQDLIACTDSPAPDLLQSIGFWWERLWAGFSGTELVAQPVIVNETPLIYGKTSTSLDLESIRAIASGEADDDSETSSDETTEEGQHD